MVKAINKSRSQYHEGDTALIHFSASILVLVNSSTVSKVTTVIVVLVLDASSMITLNQTTVNQNIDKRQSFNAVTSL